MTRATLAALFILGISIWSVLAMMTVGFVEYLRKPGNSVRFSVWVGALILVIITLFAPDDKPLASFRTDAISIAITVIVLEELGRYRSGLEEKERIIRQMSSRSNDFALDAARVIVHEEWHKDGSLCKKNFSFANLHKAHLWEADLAGADFGFAILEEAVLDDAILRGASLYEANLKRASLGEVDLRNADLQNCELQETRLFTAKLQGANLQGAKYTVNTEWPGDFDPKEAGAILVEWSESKQDWVPSLKGKDLLELI